MKIYISGQITGLSKPDYVENFRKAVLAVYLNIDRKVHDIEGVYYEDIINPLEIIPFLGRRKKNTTFFNFEGSHTIKHWSEFYKENWINYMISDIREQRKCTHSAFQKNWIESRGACIEYYASKFIFKQTIIFL